MAGIQIFAAGRAGDGTGSHAGVLAWALKDMGAWTFTWKEEVYSNIYTRDSCNAVRAADFPIFAPDDECDDGTPSQAISKGAECIYGHHVITEIDMPMHLTPSYLVGFHVPTSLH